MESISIFHHHIYEFRKGLRNLVLFTCRKEMHDYVIQKLSRFSITHIVYRVGENVINVFFGDDRCIEVIEQIGKPDLTAYTDEEDFILGVMLGYGIDQQCSRYLKRKRTKNTRTVQFPCSGDIAK